MDWYRLCLYWALKPSHCELFLFSPIPMFFHKSLSLAEDWTRVSVSEVFMGQHFYDNQGKTPEACCLFKAVMIMHGSFLCGVLQTVTSCMA